MSKIQQRRREDLDRRKARKKLFANAKTLQPCSPGISKRSFERASDRSYRKSLPKWEQKPPFRLKARNAR